VNNINPANVINFLFQEAVVGDVDMRALVNISDPQQQCTKLLALLHTSENPQAFVQLYLAIKEEPHLQWLIERIDNFTDQSANDLLQQRQQQQQRYISEPTGEFCNCRLNLELFFHTFCSSKISPHKYHKLIYGAQ